MENDINPNLITVNDDDGVTHTFEELDRIETDSGKYLALTPVFDEAQEVLDDDGELIIVRVNDSGDEIYLEPIEDQDLYDEIGAVFEERLQDLFFIKNDENNMS